MALASFGARLAIVAVIVAAGGVLTGLLYNDVSSSETQLSKLSFKGALLSQLTNFEAFIVGQLRSIRALSDAMSLRNSVPSPEEFERVGRMYESLFQSSFGGIAILAKVARDSAAIAEWANATQARYNRTVTVRGYPPYADTLDDSVWIVQDPLPQTPDILALIGYQLSTNPLMRTPLVSLLDAVGPSPHPGNISNTSSLLPLYGECVTISGLQPFSNTGDQLGFMAFTTLFDGPDPSYVLVTPTIFDNYVKAVRAVTHDAVLVIEDHLGNRLLDGGCALEDTDQVLTRTIAILSNVQWTVSLGQCPAYTASYVSGRRSVILAICLVVTVLATAAAVFGMLFHHRMVVAATERVKNAEKAAAHQLIVGYICHELRNPLHIVKTSFKMLSSVARQYTAERGYKEPLMKYDEMGELDDSSSGGGEGDEDMTAVEPAEILCVVSDAKAALGQMQTTVNEVLDFRAIENGMGSLKLRVGPVPVTRVVRSVLMRCRAFLAPGIPLELVMPDPTVIAFLDKTRLSQIITNGLSNAGKFTTSGCVRVTVSLVGARSPRKSILPRQSTQLASPVATRERRSWFKRVMTRRRRRQIADSAVATSTATSPLTVDVEAAPDSHTFVCVTISNTRAGAPIPDPEDCFIPFRQAGGGGAWKPVEASPAHIAAMRSLWLSSMERARSVVPVRLPDLKTQANGPVKATTGLGLPLCRGFASASGGWLALDESLGDGMTHFWCVLKSSETPTTSSPRFDWRSSQTVRTGSKSFFGGPSKRSSKPSSFAPSQLSRQPLMEEPARPQTVTPSITLFSPTTAVENAIVSASVGPFVLDEKPLPPLEIPPARAVAFDVATTETDLASHHDSNDERSPLSSMFQSRSGGNLTMAATPCSHASGSAVAVDSFASLVVAFVDDDPANQRIGSRFLRQLGVKKESIVSLVDGNEALACLQNGMNLRSLVVPDVMFLDIRMPGKSGLEVLKQCPKPLPFPVIAMSGNVDKDSVAGYRECGFAGCIGKPFERKQLRQVLECALKGEWTAIIAED